MNTFDHNGLAGALPGWGNVFTACGFSGHGMQQAPAVGSALAALITGGRESAGEGARESASESASHGSMDRAINGAINGAIHGSPGLQALSPARPPGLQSLSPARVAQGLPLLEHNVI